MVGTVIHSTDPETQQLLSSLLAATTAAPADRS